MHDEFEGFINGLDSIARTGPRPALEMIAAAQALALISIARSLKAIAEVHGIAQPTPGSAEHRRMEAKRSV